jgi:cell division septum initiation protein DivIVA
MPDEVTDQIESSATDTAATAEDLQAQIAELREQVAESQRTAQFWADKAQTTPRPAPAPASAVEEEEPDVLEAITTGGAKGFDQLAAKRGFVRKSEVEALIDAKASTLTKEQALMDEYPDLKNKGSEFFKATAVNYGELVKQGTPGLVAMEMAARQTELAFLRAGKAKPDAPGADEKEARRLARIAAQSGGGNGGRRPAAASEEDETELTPEQKHICDAMGITYEAYAKRAKAGVAIGGRASR